MARLGDICEILNGYAFKSEKYISSGVRIIRIANVQKGYIEDTAPAFYPIDTPDIEKYTLYEDDLLISLTGNVGRVAVLKKEFLPAALNQRVACLRLKDGVKYDKSFLYCFLNSNYFENKCIQSAKGVAQKNMSTEWLKEYEIPDLNMEEQKEISTVLSKISELIAVRTQQLSKLNELIKSRFIELLQPYFDKGETQPLIGLVCEDRPITYGILKPGTNREGGYPVIRVKDFSRGLVSVEEVLHTTPEIYNKYLRSVLAEGDIIISIGGTIGRIAIVPKEFVGANITQHTARIALKDKRYLLYFRGLLESDIMQRWMKDRVLGVAQPSINLGDVKQMPIPIVDECVIKELNAFVEQTDKSKLAVQQSLEKLETLKRSLMQKYFG